MNCPHCGAPEHPTWDCIAGVKLDPQILRKQIGEAIRDLKNSEADLLTKAVARQFLKLHGVQYGVEEPKHAG